MNAQLPARDRQLKHESPELGDAIVRMMRGLVTRAAEGDTEALEQLKRVEEMAAIATPAAALLANQLKGYSFTFLAGVLGISRQGCRQRAMAAAPLLTRGAGHVLMPGHNKRSCATCQDARRA